MKTLITAGPTHEPIDAVRYIGNRSSGKMGVALAAAAIRAGHVPTLILGPISPTLPANLNRIDVETAAQMLDAVLREFPRHDLLIMAAAVADYRPVKIEAGKIQRKGNLTIECQATEDIAAAAGKIKRPNQRTIGFSLESHRNIDRARQKLLNKNLDLIVYNPTETMNSDTIESILLYADGRQEALPRHPKSEFGDILLARAAALFA